MPRRLRLVLLALCTALVSAEALLQLAYFVMWSAGGRQEPTAAGGAAGPAVLCLGDSFTYGMGASSPAGSYPAQLETALNAAGMACRVVNRGWPARNSREVLAMLDANLAQVAPRFVCITVGVNDSWSRPEELRLPEAVPAGPGAATPVREPYVWTFRLLRLVDTFRTKDPFRDSPEARLAAPATRSPEFLRGKWRSFSPALSLRLEADGSGALSDQAVRWRTDGDRIELVAEGQPAIQATWRDDSGVLVLVLHGQEFRMSRENGADTPADPVAAGYEAMFAANWPKALACFEKAIQGIAPADPRLPNHHAALVRCRSALGRRDEALAELAIVRRLVAERGALDTADALASALSALGFQEEADQVVTAAIERGTVIPSLWTSFAQVSERRGDLPGARRAISRAIELAIAAKWTRLAFLYRTQATLHREPEFRTEFADAAVAAHLDDGRSDSSRQLFGMWSAPNDGKEASVRAACERRQVPDDVRDLLVRLVHEATGGGGEDWERILASHLQQMIQRCRRAGAQPVLGNYPFRFVARHVLQRVAEQEACPLVEQDVVFAAVRAEAPNRVLNVADGHCNDDGYGIMAAQFAKAIQALAAKPGQPTGVGR
ncbi:MAG: GDSL-type esterase/lipase family protein [Planctomycetota bacterium]